MVSELLVLSCLTSSMIPVSSELKKLPLGNKYHVVVIAGKLVTGTKSVLDPQENLSQFRMLHIRLRQNNTFHLRPESLLLLKIHGTLHDYLM